MADLDEVAARAVQDGLAPLGLLHPGDDGPPGVGTLVLLGPDEPGFWTIFRASPEFRDGAPDPLDRWSARVIGGLADEFGAAAFYPFGGPPWRPFTGWARASGVSWESPVGLLVHAARGLFVSFRGALGFRERLALPAAGRRPCDGCARPCLRACPVGALGASGYDVARCHAFLDTAAGADCLARGCAVRRACPVGQGLRPDAQSAFYMTAFHGRQAQCDD
jgi:hypothetical protein